MGLHRKGDPTDRRLPAGHCDGLAEVQGVATHSDVAEGDSPPDERGALIVGADDFRPGVDRRDGMDTEELVGVRGRVGGVLVPRDAVLRGLPGRCRHGDSLGVEELDAHGRCVGGQGGAATDLEHARADIAAHFQPKAEAGSQAGAVSVLNSYRCLKVTVKAEEMSAKIAVVRLPPLCCRATSST